MKIVQSFWTKPFLREGPNMTGSRMNGGWPHRKLNYCSWALSCLQLRSFYNSVELVTDRWGKEILIDALQLPYTKVHVELDCLHSFHHGLWALGKLYAYGMQQEPFLHVDNDVFIWAPFSNTLCQAGMIAQNLQHQTASYASTYRTVLDTFSFIPGYLKPYAGLQFVPCVNAGILGGNDISFIQQYVKEVMVFIDSNMVHFNRLLNGADLADLNVICEQVILYAYAKVRGKTVSCLFPDHEDIPPDIGLFHAAAVNRQFVHCLGGYKKLRIVYAFLENRLKTAYPSYYKRIGDLISTIEL